MSAQIFRVNPSKAFSGTLGPQLLNAIENLNQSYAVLLTLRAAMIQQKDANTGGDPDSDYATIAATFGFVGSDGTTLSNAVAHQAFLEIDSMVGNGGPSLTQLAARFKQ